MADNIHISDKTPQLSDKTLEFVENYLDEVKKIAIIRKAKCTSSWCKAAAKSEWRAYSTPTLWVIFGVKVLMLDDASQIDTDLLLLWCEIKRRQGKDCHDSPLPW